MPRTAREIFRTGPHKTELEKIVQTAAFESACQAAILAIVEDGPQTFATPETSWQVGVYVAGARRALDILATLHLPEEPPKTPKSPSLDYSLK